MGTALEIPTASRKPDGVLLEPSPALPTTEERGQAQAGVLALRPPVGDEQIREAVHDYLQAFVNHSTEALRTLLTTDAILLENRQPQRYILENFQRRTSQHISDYARYDGVEIARFDHLERYAAEDLGPHTDPPRPPDMHSGDVYVRVPLIPTVAANGDPLFRTMLVLILRRATERRLQIAGVAELDAP
jgi:hypothetical protein